MQYKNYRGNLLTNIESIKQMPGIWEETKKELIRTLIKNESERDIYKKAKKEKIEKRKQQKSKLWMNNEQNLPDNDIEKSESDGEFVNKYKRDKKIWEIIISFTNSRYDNFYDEWDVIFVNNVWNSDIFDLEWDVLKSKWKKYYEIKKIGDFYLWINIETKWEWINKQKINWSEKCTVLNKKWEEILNAKWWFNFVDIWNSYRDNYSESWEKYFDLYNQNLQKIANKIPDKSALIWEKDWKLLFMKSSYKTWEKKIYFILKTWAEWDWEYKTDSEIENEEVFVQYLNSEKEKSDLRNKNKKEYQKMDLDFDIEFEEWTWDIKSIKNKEWEILFEGDDKFRYSISRPYWIYSKADTKNKKDEINSWLLLIQWIQWSTIKKSIFLNLNAWNKLEFDTYPEFTFLNWKTIRHFIDSNISELYNAKWEKLWKIIKNIDNENDFQFIINEDWKNQLVENLTWEVKKQEFDEYLETYEEWNKKFVIVKNYGKLFQIEILK